MLRAIEEKALKLLKIVREDFTKEMNLKVRIQTKWKVEEMPGENNGILPFYIYKAVLATMA